MSLRAGSSAPEEGGLAVIPSETQRIVGSVFEFVKASGSVQLPDKGDIQRLSLESMG